MAWALITPANRGIGFHLTRHLLQNTSMPVLATTRKDPTGVKKSLLADLDSIDAERLDVLELDVTDEQTIERAATHARSRFRQKDHHLRLAFSLPGILHPEKSPAQLSHADLTSTFAVNTIGPLLLMKHFSGFLPGKSSSALESPQEDEGKETELPPYAIWTNLSARVGSTSDNSLGGWYSYRASKAALTSATKTFDLYLRTRSGDNAMAIAYHPGTVKTGLSEEFWGSVKKEKLFEPEKAVGFLWDVTVGRKVGIEGRGRCWDWKGVEVEP